MKDGAVTLTGLGVMIVALSRFTMTANPEFLRHLQATLVSAESAGLQADDLELLKLVIKSISVASGGDGP